MASEVEEIEAILREHVYATHGSTPCGQYTDYEVVELGGVNEGAQAIASYVAALRAQDREGAREPSEFRVGRRVPRNVYRGDDGIFMARTEAEAAELVALLNAGRLALVEQEARRG